MSRYPAMPSLRLYLYIADIFMSPEAADVELEVGIHDSPESKLWSLRLLPGEPRVVSYPDQFGYWLRQCERRFETQCTDTISVTQCTIGFSLERGNLAQFVQQAGKRPHAHDLTGPVICLIYQS